MTPKPSKTLDELTGVQKGHITRLFLEGQRIDSSTTIAPSVIEDVIRESFQQMTELYNESVTRYMNLRHSLRAICPPEESSDGEENIQ